MIDLNDDTDPEEELTPIVCSRCNARFTFGAGRTATECPVCRGRMNNPSQWRATNERAMTANGLATLVADLLQRLKRSSSPRAQELAGAARGFLRTFETWKKTPPDGPERAKLVTAVAEWHVHVWGVLEEKQRKL